jgi:hypothetical protein
LKASIPGFRSQIGDCATYLIAMRAQGAILRKLHTVLKAKDPGFGGLIRVMNKRKGFLWVHPRFEKEY